MVASRLLAARNPRSIATVSVLVFVCLISAGFGQNDNGIGVSPAKIYDNRSLVIMLEELNRQLQSIKVIDQKSLLDNLGLVQGYQNRDVARSFGFGTVPIPGVTTTRKPNDEGNLEITEEKSEQKEVSALPPSLPELLTVPKYEPKFGISSEDLLTQQIDLTYKIFNLRMLLERSISDRLMNGNGIAARTTLSTNFANDGGEIKVSSASHNFPTGLEGRFTSSGNLPGGLNPNSDYYIIRINADTYKIAKSYEDASYGRGISFVDNGTGSHTFTPKDSNTRLQTVVGFNVSLDPPKDKKDMAAFVELTIKTADGKPISVVALMPQEKTYNSSALSTKSNSFGGSAVVKVITIGYSERRRGQTFYLYQDADTITYQRMPDIDGSLDGKSPTFGWGFRPVLGRRSVSPGMRQMFAVISLSKSDLFGIKDLSKLNVEIKTYWRKYDRKTLTVFDDAVHARNFTSSASVPSTSRFQESLKPVVKDVKWSQLDEKNGVLTIDGENFFTGTSVLLGNNVFDNQTNGLTIKSEQNLQLRTSIDSFAGSEIVLNGRYGGSLPIVMPNKSLTAKGIALDNFTIEPISEKTSRIKLKLYNKNLTYLTSETQAKSDSSVALIGNSGWGNLLIEDIEAQQFPPFVIVKNTSFPAKDALQPENCSIEFTQFDGRPLTIGGSPANADKSNLHKKGCVVAIVDVPSALLKEDTPISFRIPLLGPDWQVTKTFYYNLQASNVKLSKIADLAGGDSKYWITGNNLSRLQLLPTDGITITPSISNDKLIEFQLTKAQISILRSIILRKDNGDPVVLPLPREREPDPPPTITETIPLQLYVNDSRTVTFKGKKLKNVRQVLFEGKDLQIIRATDDEITVSLTRDVTKTSGGVEIILKFDNGVFVTAALTILKQL
jgi:hypothetical protein